MASQMKWLCRLFAILPALAAGIAHSDTPVPRLLADFYAETRSLSGTFEQRVLSSQGRELEHRSGRFALSRPGRFRWDYQQPYEQLIVSNGERLWIWDPDLEQASVRPVDAELGTTPVALLSESSFPAEDFSFEPGPDNASVILHPRDAASGFEWVRIEFADGMPQRLSLRDGLGQTTEIELQQLEQNPSLQSGTFEFEPPPQADVIGVRP